MRVLRHLAWPGLSSLALFAALPAFAQPPGPRLFTPVKDTPALADWRARVCALLPQPCEARSLALYRPRERSVSDDAFVVTSAVPLARAELRRGADGAWSVQRLDDFRHYRHSMADGTESREPTLGVAPTLYPLGPGRWAAALTWTVTDMYSGGGAAFTTADFVALPTPGTAVPAVAAVAAHAGVPFACSQMIRACFGEKEYRQSPHCHDETSGSLRIAYEDSAPDYRWRYTWRETEWPAHKPRRMQTTATLAFGDGEGGKAAFCGGPQ